MYLTTETKKEIFAKHGKSDADTGSAEGQVALFTYRINHLSAHQRKALLDYLKKKDINRYRAIIAELGLRK